MRTWTEKKGRVEWTMPSFVLSLALRNSGSHLSDPRSDSGISRRERGHTGGTLPVLERRFIHSIPCTPSKTRHDVRQSQPEPAFRPSEA